eukprot:jgi/Astpho2/3790/Aster-x1171
MYSQRHLQDLAAAQGPLTEGRRHWARKALQLVRARLAAETMMQLKSQPVLAEERLELGSLVIAQTEVLSSDLTLTTGLLDRLGTECRERLAAVKAETHIERLRVLNALLFGPREQSNSGEDGAGSEQGNTANYYDPANSLLPCVFKTGLGIPISLAVIYVAVGRRAGLPLDCVGLPGHVVAQLRERESGPSDSIFIDVFDQGRIMSWDQLQGFLEFPVRDLRVLKGLSATEVYVRQARNLLNIYRQEADIVSLRLLLEVVKPLCMPADQDTGGMMLMYVQACAASEDWEAAQEVLQELASPSAPPNIQLTAARMAELIGREQVVHEMDKARVKLRPSQEVIFRIGTVMTHRRYDYLGVITDWDPQCKASDQWIQQMGVDSLPGGRHQPFYHVLENIVPVEGPGPFKVGIHFDGIPSNDIRYQLNAYMKHRFPQN